MARLLKNILVSNYSFRILASAKETHKTVTECYIHSIYTNLLKIRLGCNVTVVVVSLASSTSQPLYCSFPKNSLLMENYNNLQPLSAISALIQLQAQNSEQQLNNAKAILKEAQRINLAIKHLRFEQLKADLRNSAPSFTIDKTRVN